MDVLYKLRRLDTFTIVLTLLLTAVGTVAIYGATVGTRLEHLYKDNLVLIAISIIPLLAAAILNYELLMTKMAYVLYGVGILLLILVHFIGEDAYNAVRWIKIGGLQFQPSEMMKLFIILLIARLLANRGGESLRPLHDLLPIVVLTLVPVAFILKQPDLGTALMFIGIMVGMLWMGNIRAIYLIAMLAIIFVSIMSIYWLFYYNYELLATFVKPHQMSRIQVFLDPSSDPDKAWHVLNAMAAVGSGGLAGNESHYLKLGYIPFAYSDSVFVVIGEKFGFIGSAGLLLLFFLLIYRMMLIAIEHSASAGSYLVVGIVGMFVSQVFVNIGMHIGILPLTGIPLPFISYGGSSLMTSMIAIGLVLSVHIHKPN